MNVRFDKVSADQHEIVLRLHISTKQQQRMTLTIDVHQAGLFKLSGFPDEQLQHLLHVYCPDILHPYARKSIADAMIELSFPPVLSPVNFEDLYHNRKLPHPWRTKPPSLNLKFWLLSIKLMPYLAGS